MGRKSIRTIAFVLFVVCAVRVSAQTVVPDRIVPDTAVIRKQYDESNRFYDKLRKDAEDSRLARRLIRALVSEDDQRFTTESVETSLEKEASYFSAFEGMRIDSIRIYRGNIFSGRYPSGDFRTIANSLHVVTRENKIWRNVLFKEGETVSSLVFAQNEQLLRSLGYLSDASILLEQNPDGEGVIVNIITRDSWSIGFTVRSVPNNRRYIDIYDSNMFGSGDRLDLRTYVNYKGKMYGGNMLQYHASNLWGSFFQLDMIGGWGYEERHFGIKLNKEYILPSDFIAGGIAEDKKYYEWETLTDTMPLNHRRNYDLWAGKSWAFPAVNGSFYVGARFQDLTFYERPEVRPDSNTYYHSRRMLLFNTGIYRETYYRGNMIYGYGRTENVPYGHRFEFTAGKVWGEFGDKWYTAFDAAVGKQTKIGYFRAGATLSSYWDEKSKPLQGALELEFDAFSNLWKVRRSYLRQFLTIRYLQGLDRLEGEGEQLTFWQDNSPRNLRNDYRKANTRLVMKNETVLFSPVYFYGFRFVFFGFADVGWIGNDHMPFKNDFYTAFGLGVRLKNERLIFNTIQLSFGVALNKSGWADYRHFRYSTQQSLEVPQFRADHPDVFEFR